jgi:hypothetical protein
MEKANKFYWDESTIEYLVECYDNDGEHHMILRLKRTRRHVSPRKRRNLRRSRKRLN